MARKFPKSRLDTTPTKRPQPVGRFRLIRPSVDVDFDGGSDSRTCAREGRRGELLDRLGGLRRQREGDHEAQTDSAQPADYA